MCRSQFSTSMNSKSVHKRNFKRYNSVVDVNSKEEKSAKMQHQSSIGKDGLERFTPFSKIPAIGEKMDNFKNTNNAAFSINYFSDVDKNSAVGSSKIPVFQIPTNLKTNSKDAKRLRLARRNTYTVLEPIVCVKQERNTQRKLTNLKLRQDSDADVSASDETSPKNQTRSKKKDTNLNALNYLLNNLKFSRNAENELLLPKNNPWLF